MYVHNLCLHPLHTGLAVVPHPRWMQRLFCSNGQTWYVCLTLVMMSG